MKKHYRKELYQKVLELQEEAQQKGYSITYDDVEYEVSQYNSIQSVTLACLQAHKKISQPRIGSLFEFG